METLRQLLGIQPIAALALAMLLVSATGLVVVVAIFIRHGGVMRLLHLFRNGNGKEQRGAHIDLAEKFSDLQESIESDFGEVKASLEELKTGADRSLAGDRPAVREGHGGRAADRPA